jgi:hypothetical protein
MGPIIETFQSGTTPLGALNVQLRTMMSVLVRLASRRPVSPVDPRMVTATVSLNGGWTTRPARWWGYRD